MGASGIPGQKGELLPLVQVPFIADAADVRGMKRPIIMGRIIDAAEWIKCMPIRNISLGIAIRIGSIDAIPENEGTWYWQISPEGNSFERTEEPWDIYLDIDTFLQWLSGYIPVDELIGAPNSAAHGLAGKRCHAYIGTDSCPAWSDDQ